jgi:hypothetical protein
VIEVVGLTADGDAVTEWELPAQVLNHLVVKSIDSSLQGDIVFQVHGEFDSAVTVEVLDLSRAFAASRISALSARRNGPP